MIGHNREEKAGQEMGKTGYMKIVAVQLQKAGVRVPEGMMGIGG